MPVEGPVPAPYRYRNGRNDSPGRLATSGTGSSQSVTGMTTQRTKGDGIATAGEVLGISVEQLSVQPRLRQPLRVE
jgi:hypothetical protein